VTTAFVLLGFLALVSIVMWTFSFVGTLLWYSQGSKALKIWALIVTALVSVPASGVLIRAPLHTTAMYLFTFGIWCGVPMWIAIAQLERRLALSPNLDERTAGNTLLTHSILAIPIGLATGAVVWRAFSDIYKLIYV
jgi:hypothetical protein